MHHSSAIVNGQMTLQPFGSTATNRGGPQGPLSLPATFGSGDKSVSRMGGWVRGGMGECLGEEGWAEGTGRGGGGISMH